MSAKNQYRFLREIEATEEALKPLTTKYITVPKNEDSQDSKNGKLVYCHFKNVKEQTLYTVGKPFQCPDSNIIHKRDQRCYFKDSSLRIYSRGGSEFIVPMLFTVDEVFPIENGLIAKLRYDRDKLMFDASQIRKEPLSMMQRTSIDQQKEWTYVTITEHPLDDIHPLAFRGVNIMGQTNLLPLALTQTQLEIIYVSYKLPLIILYNPLTQSVIFGFLKLRPDTEAYGGGQPGQMSAFEDENSSPYIRSIEPESRHPEIFIISREHKIVIEELYQVPAPNGPPSKVLLSKGLSNPYELNIGLFTSSVHRFELFQCDLRQPTHFRKVLDLPSITDAVQLQFIQRCNEHVQTIPRGKATQIKAAGQLQTLSEEMHTLKDRLRLLNKETMLVDGTGRRIQVYQGSCMVYNMDAWSVMESAITEKNLFSKASKIESLTNAHGSKVTINLNNGASRRVTMKVYINDFLVNSIMNVFRLILPGKLYETLNQDLVETFMKCNLELQNQGQKVESGSLLLEDQFGKFTALLLAIITGDHSQFSCLVKPAAVQGASSTTSNQMTPQPVNSGNKTATPTQTLQTKILRSSTTSFAADQMAARRKVTNPIGASQPSTYSQISQQSNLTTQLRATVLGRQSSSGVTTNSAAQAQRRIGVTGSSTGPEVGNTPLTMSSGPVIHHNLSANPFADLLNSDFHKENFGGQFSSLFPQGFNLIAPMAPTPQSTGNLPETSQIQLSPTKSTPSKHQVPAPTGGAPFSRLSQPKSATPYTYPDRKSTSSPLSNPGSSPHMPATSLDQLAIPFKTSRADLQAHFTDLFLVLHLMHEDLKLNNLREAVECPKLARLLLRLALALEPYKKAAFVEYYVNEHRDKGLRRDEVEAMMRRAYRDGNIIREGVEVEPVPKIYRWIEKAMRGTHSQQEVIAHQYPLFFETTRKVVRIYEILNESRQISYLHPTLFSNHSTLAPDTNQLQHLSLSKAPPSADQHLLDFHDYLKASRGSSLHLFERVLFTLREESLTQDHLKQLPRIISLPLLEIIRYARLFQQDIQTVPAWPDSLYRLIQREDILNNLRLFERGGAGGQKVDGSASRKAGTINRAAIAHTFEELQQENHRRQMESNIMKTAADFINAHTGLNGSGGEREKQGNNKISDFIKNRFSNDTRYKEVTNFLNSTAEIIVKLDHIANRESLTEEQMAVEKQKLLDKHFLRQLSKSVGRGALQFGTLQTLPTETLRIPKINQTGFVPITESYMQVEFKDEQSKDILQWPEFHNGVASTMKIALTFNKNRTGSEINQMQHTRNWIMYHKPSEPKYDHGGFCLAMGLLGQLDTLQPTDIYQHLKSTHDATTIGILLGRAASKIGTMDDHDTRTLCIHIPYLLPPTLSLEVSLSVQSAAVIGAGLLYKGTSNRLMTEMLLAQIGRKPLSDKAIEREGYALASGIALGLVNLGIGNKMQGLIDLKLDERLIRYVEGGKIIDLPQSMLSQNFNHENTKCSSIKEGDMVNLHITSQGALIALSLIHLKSNNQAIADQLSMPQTFYSLESVRPSFLLLKTLCKNLIMWDTIACSQAWVESQIPGIIRDIYTSDISQVTAKYQQKKIEDGIDFSTVALCYVNIIAGAVFSIGFKYAGTGNVEAFKIVQEYSNFFRKLKIIQTNKDSIGMVHTNLTKNQVDKNTVETCLCVSAFAMSIIMAGTGDIECFRTLRVLRKRFEHDMHYGYNLAINMSLGFLFLGGGAFTFSRNNLSLAALICSLYPIFPTSPSDNRYHLQALRHFYVLAIESRLLQARDIDTGEFLNIAMNVEVFDNRLASDGQTLPKIVKIVTPDIINGIIKKIEVQNEQYHNVSLKFAVPTPTKQQAFSEQMEIDEGGNANAGDNTRKLLEKRQKIFEQFDFQKIVYVKKKTSSNLQQSAKNTSFTVRDKKHIIDDNLGAAIQNIDIKTRSVVEDANEIHQTMSLIKESTVQSFNQTFTQVGRFAKLTHFNEIEDVLLAQSRENFNQMTPAEFFRIEELYDQIKESMMQSYVPESLKEKLGLLQHLHDIYYSDKLEFLPLMLDSHFSVSTLPTPLSLAYQAFKLHLPLYEELLTKEQSLNLLQSDPLLPVPAVSPSPSLGSQASSLIATLTTPHLLARKPCTFDFFELKVIKQLTEQVLDQLRSQGPAEAEGVKKYRFLKTSGLKIEQGTVEHEINEVLKQVAASVTGESMEVINEVIITAVITVDK